MSRGIKLTAVYKCYLWLCAFLMLPMAKARGSTFWVVKTYLQKQTVFLLMQYILIKEKKWGVPREHPYNIIPRQGYIMGSYESRYKTYSSI